MNHEKQVSQRPNLIGIRFHLAFRVCTHLVSSESTLYSQRQSIVLLCTSLHQTKRRHRLRAGKPQQPPTPTPTTPPTTTLQATDLRPSKEENKEHCMELCTPGRNYFMYADSAAELQEWTKLIRRAGNITV